MLRALAYFLVGCLVLAVVIYVCSLILALLALPPAISHIALIILGLLGLLALVWLAVRVFKGGGPDLFSFTAFSLLTLEVTMKRLFIACALTLLIADAAWANGFGRAPRFFNPGSGCGGCYGQAPVFQLPPPPPRVIIQRVPVYRDLVPDCAPRLPCPPRAPAPCGDFQALNYGAGFAPSYGVGFGQGYGSAGFALQTPGFGLQLGAIDGGGRRFGLLDRLRLNRLNRLQAKSNNLQLKLFR